VSDKKWTQFKTNQPSFDEVARARAILEAAGEVVPPQQLPTRDIPVLPVANVRHRFTIDGFFNGCVHVVGAGCLFFFVVPFVVGLVALAVSKMKMEPGALIAVPAWAVVIALLFYLSREKVRARTTRS
jgi:hypothetical protein